MKIGDNEKDVTGQVEWTLWDGVRIRDLSVNLGLAL
jgi:hypothetical protein